MIGPQIFKLYELKGRLEAREIILDSDIVFTQRLRERLVTAEYNGYAKGKLEALREWQQDNKLVLETVCQITEELEGVWE